jgi:hypothetical protein
MTFDEWLDEQYGEDTDPFVRRVASEAWSTGQKIFKEAAIEACIESESEYGEEHDPMCDCVTPVEDECSCYMSRARRKIEAISLEEDDEQP